MLDDFAGGEDLRELLLDFCRIDLCGVAEHAVEKSHGVFLFAVQK